MYGMTSLLIRQNVLRLYKQLGLREKDITKVQTGSPDGDLSSSTHFNYHFLSLKVLMGRRPHVRLVQMKSCSVPIRRLPS
jgi:hypothetical protein